MSEWFDMESAPKDGTRILVDDANDGVMWVCWEQEEIHYPGCLPEYKWCVPGSHQDEQGGAYTADNPLAWMPVPERKNKN